MSSLVEDFDPRVMRPDETGWLLVFGGLLICIENEQFARHLSGALMSAPDQVLRSHRHL
jgi:hypothetical protein